MKGCSVVPGLPNTTRTPPAISCSRKASAPLSSSAIAGLLADGPGRHRQAAEGSHHVAHVLDVAERPQFAAQTRTPLAIDAGAIADHAVELLVQFSVAQRVAAVA